MVATAAACAGNAAEVLLFPLVAGAGGVRAALALSAALTLVYVVFVVVVVPETRGKTPDQIYEELGPSLPLAGKEECGDAPPSTEVVKPIGERDHGFSPTPMSTKTESEDEMTHF